MTWRPAPNPPIRQRTPGTLDEATEVLELRKHGRYDKPVVLLNTDGFYDGLMTQLRRMEAEGFLPLLLTELLHVVDTPADALTHLEKSASAHRA